MARFSVGSYPRAQASSSFVRSHELPVLLSHAGCFPLGHSTLRTVALVRLCNFHLMSNNDSKLCEPAARRGDRVPFAVPSRKLFPQKGHNDSVFQVPGGYAAPRAAIFETVLIRCAKIFADPQAGTIAVTVAAEQVDVMIYICAIRVWWLPP